MILFDSSANQATSKINWGAMNRTLHTCFISNLYSTVAVPCYFLGLSVLSKIKFIWVVENIILPCIFKLQSKSAHKFSQRYGYDIIYDTHDTSLEMCQNYTGLSSIADAHLWKNLLKPMQILCFLHCNKFIYLDT